MSARAPRDTAGLAAAFGHPGTGIALPAAKPLPPPTPSVVAHKPARVTTPKRATEPVTVPEPRGRVKRSVYAALEPATAERLRTLGESTRKTYIVMLGEAVDALNVDDLRPHLPASTTTSMPGVSPRAVPIKGTNLDIRVTTEQEAWIASKHAQLAPTLALRQFLGLALTAYVSAQERTP